MCKIATRCEALQQSALIAAMMTGSVYLILLVWFCRHWTHLWLDDSKQVPSNDQLLGKAVVLIRLEGNAKEAHDAGVVGQV